MADLAIRAFDTSRPGPVLVVGGFQRLDGTMSVPEDLSALGLGIVQRGLMTKTRMATTMTREEKSR